MSAMTTTAERARRARARPPFWRICAPPRGVRNELGAPGAAMGKMKPKPHDAILYSPAQGDTDQHEAIRVTCCHRSSAEQSTKYCTVRVQYSTRYCTGYLPGILYFDGSFTSVYCTQYITVQTVVLPITGLLSVSLNDTL